VRAEDSCHGFPEATRHGPLRRMPSGQVRGAGNPGTTPVTGQPPGLSGEGKEPAPGGAYGPAPRQAMTFMVTRWLCGRAHPCSTCSRRLTVTPVVSWLEPAGQGKRSLSCPISGRSLIPACHGCVSQRYSRVNPGPCANPVRCPGFTEFPQREWGHSARSGTVLRGDHNASPSLLLDRARPAKDYAMTLFQLLPPMMTVAVCGGAHAASFRRY
jgi:hypothetical protein